jgi:SAM-dependent methyltransferase
VSGREWPVVCGIPFMRAGREALADEALAALRADDEAAATALLLADQDDWAPTPPPSPADCRAAMRDGVSFREAMERLSFGPVADYFAHRWSDPTYLSGLALLSAHASPGDRVFELACGTGAFLRALSPGGAGTTGADVVWAKLWLARRYVVPEARLVCFDAAAADPWPVAPGFDVAFCHDALYFLPEKAHVVAQLRRLAPRVLIGHAHNAEEENLSAGDPLAPAGYRALLGDAVTYDDAELTRALLEDRAPRPSSGEGAAALAFVAPPAEPAGAGRLALTGRSFRRNPLLTDGWPSARYEAEYAADMEYLTRAPAGLGREDLIRRRVLVDLPEAW